MLASVASTEAERSKGGDTIVAAPSNPGLQNLGNTCFMNAVLQGLAGIDLWRRDVDRAVDNPSVHEPGSSLAHVFRKLMHEMSRANGGVVSPQALVDCIHQPESPWVQKHKAQKGVQQSADEFLQFLLEEDDMLRDRTTFHARELNGCSDPKGSPQPFPTLPIALVRRSRVSLSALIHAQYALTELNDVLIIVVNRSKKNGEKDNTEISTPNDLDIFDKDGNRNGQYSLEGIVNHHGGGSNNGHYFAASRRMVKGVITWMNFNDEKCEVLEKGKAESQVRQPCPRTASRAPVASCDLERSCDI